MKTNDLMGGQTGWFSKFFGVLERLVSRGMDKAPRWLAPLLVIAGLGAAGAFSIAVLFLAAKSTEYAYKLGVAAVAFCAIAMGVYLIALLIPKGNDDSDSAAAPQAGAPKAKRAECPQTAPLLRQACDRVKSGAQGDLSIRSFCCPGSDPTPEAKLTEYSIYHLWADPRGGAISACLDTPEDPAHLVIDFSNTNIGWAGNVTLRPCGVRPLAVAGFNYLCLDLKCESADLPGDVKQAGVAFRIYDERGSIWMHGKSQSDLHVKPLQPGQGKWQTVSLPLRIKEEWALFQTDGNHLYAGPDGPVFGAMILAVVIVAGAYRGNQEPGPGKGRILVRNLRLSVEKPSQP